MWLSVKKWIFITNITNIDVNQYNIKTSTKCLIHKKNFRKIFELENEYALRY